MRRAFTEDEEELDERTGDRAGRHADQGAAYADQDREDDREVTLSSTSLLMIFFGLVLVCGLFFGLGYTLGRRSHAETADAIPSSEPASSPLVASAQPKPSPASQSPVVPSPVSDAQPADSATPAPVDDGNQAAAAQDSTPSASTPKPTPALVTPAPVRVTAPPTPIAQVKPALTPVTQPSSAASAPSTPAASGIMVQIAAVSNPADADVLVGALRKRGYSVTIRNQPGDALLHVQVGPFAARADAIAMKQKLLSDGYNAILK
jgi:cell division septation protein DedD